eukprot:364525-Chlamydomonas_euryale.AAC.5
MRSPHPLKPQHHRFRIGCRWRTATQPRDPRRGSALCRRTAADVSARPAVARGADAAVADRMEEAGR